MMMLRDMTMMVVLMVMRIMVVVAGTVMLTVMTMMVASTTPPLLGRPSMLLAGPGYSALNSWPAPYHLPLLLNPSPSKKYQSNCHNGTFKYKYHFCWNMIGQAVKLCTGIMHTEH